MKLVEINARNSFFLLFYCDYFHITYYKAEHQILKIENKNQVFFSYNLLHESEGF